MYNCKRHEGRWLRTKRHYGDQKNVDHDEFSLNGHVSVIPAILSTTVLLSKVPRSSHFLLESNEQENAKDNCEICQHKVMKYHVILELNLYGNAHERRRAEQYGVHVDGKDADNHTCFRHLPRVV